MKHKTYHIVWTVLTSNSKIIERGNIDTPPHTHTHMWPLKFLTLTSKNKNAEGDRWICYSAHINAKSILSNKKNHINNLFMFNELIVRSVDIAGIVFHELVIVFHSLYIYTVCVIRSYALQEVFPKILVYIF